MVRETLVRPVLSAFLNGPPPDLVGLAPGTVREILVAALRLRRLGSKQMMEMLRVLPVYQQLIRSLCAYDVVGFHTPADLRAFNEAVSQEDIGGLEHADRRNVDPSRRTRADVFPIGIDVDVQPHNRIGF